MSEMQSLPTDRRALLAGIGGLAAGTFLAGSAAQAGSLTPPGAPNPTMKTLTEVEPRRALSASNTPGDGSAVFVIVKPGSYYLTGELSVPAGLSGIRVACSGVTIDLMGFAIRGELGPTGFPASESGIVLDYATTHVVISRGRLQVLGIGINGEESESHVMVREVQIEHTRAEGIFLQAYSHVEDCTLSGANNISVGEDSCVRQCSVTGSNYGGITVGARSVVTSNFVRGTFEAAISAYGGSIIEGNSVMDCSGGGIRILSGGGAMVRGNIVRNTSAFGLRVDSADNTVVDNSVRGCTENYLFAAGNKLELLISQVPQRLSWPCVARLEGDLQGVPFQNGLSIESSYVTIDLSGHTMRGGPDSGYGITSLRQPFEGITIRNGSLTEWWDGLYFSTSGGPYTAVGSIHVQGIHACANRKRGIDVRNCSAFIRDCHAHRNGEDGIWTQTRATDIANCKADGNELNGFFLERGGSIRDCSANRNVRCGFKSDDGVSIKMCVAYSNGEDGVNAVVGVVENCHCSINTRNGIRAELLAIIGGNLCDVNGRGNNGSDGSGIEVIGYGVRMQDNNCYDNGTGIKVNREGNIIVRNSCSGNKQNNWNIAAGNKCLVVEGVNAGAILGNSGGVSPGSTDPNANYTY